MRMWRLILLRGTVMAAALGLPGQALAGWGDDWGAMMWNEAVAVPTLGIVGLTLLAMGLAATAAWALRQRRRALGLTLTLVLLVIPLAVVAGTLVVPNTFVNGTMADAGQVNANFDAVETEVNDNDARITANTAAASANTTIISENGPYVLSGTGSTSVGMDALAYDGPEVLGNYLTAFGSGALEVNSTGDSNTAVGWNALNENVDGRNNTAVGNEALLHNYGDFFNGSLANPSWVLPNDGSFNTAVGARAQVANITGSHNTALGSSAGNCESASYNTAIGSGTIGNCGIYDFEPLTGAEIAYNYNTAVGASALASDLSGNSNTAVGAFALWSSSGGANTAVGAFALENSGLGGQTAVGYRALNSIVGGISNVAIGRNALSNLEVGSGNIGIGVDAGSALVGATYPSDVRDNILIGNAGTATDDAIIRLGTPGTHTETFLSGKVEVNDPASSGSGRIILDPTDVGSGYSTTLSMDDTGMKLGHNSSIRDIQFQTNGTTRMTIAAGGDLSVTGSLILGSGGDIVVSGGFTGINSLGSFAGGNFIDSDSGTYARAGYGSNSIYGNGFIRGVGAYINGSDLRLKKNISDIDNPLDTLLALRGVEFEWRNENLGGGKKFGFIAQEAEEVVPQVVIAPMEFDDPAEKDGVGEYYGMEYGNLTALLTEAVKELKAEKDVEIAALEKATAEKDVEIAALKQRLALVEQFSVRLAALEAQVRADARVVQDSNASAGW